MRVLFTSSLSYPPQDFGGSQSSTHAFCLGLKKRGHEAALLCNFENNGWFGLWTRLRRKISRRHNFPADHFFHYPAYRGWEIADGIPEVSQRFRPDIAVAGAGQTIRLAKALVKAGIPTVVCIRDVEFEQMGGSPFADPMVSYIANSDFTASVLSRRFGIDSVVIPPLVYPEHYQVHSDRSHVLHVNPHPSKGIDITMELARRRPDIPFIIIEAWNLRDALLDKYREMASKLPNVTWKERMSDMRKVYQHTRIVLAPSQWNEAWGRIATEPHVSGIPVIASTRGGLPESVGPGGLLVDPDAPIDAWLEALSTLWDNPKEYVRFATAASLYSKRPEIQPDFLLNKFANVLESHIKTSAPNKCRGAGACINAY